MFLTDTIEVEAVISEPGDRTRYSYLYYRDGPDDFVFAPMRNTFTYPQRINAWDVEDVTSMDDPAVTEIASRYSCNPFTVMECIRLIHHIWRQ